MTFIVTFRKFSMRLTKKTTYPSYCVDIPTDIVLQNPDGSVLFHTHSFDKPEAKKLVKKWRKDNIAYGNAPMRGQQPVRFYHKINESKIPASTRMGFNTDQR